MGLAYDLTDYTTVFTETNVLTATSSTQFAQHLATVASVTSWDAIHLDPVGNPFTWPNNALDLISRPVNRPLVIRTKPGSGQQAQIGGNPLENIRVPGAVALVDLKFLGTMQFQAGGSNIQIERCVGWFSMAGAISGGVAVSPPLTNFIFRLNTAANHFITTAGNVHGFYCFNVEGMLFEGNVFDHNGWGPAMTRSTPLANGGPNDRKHNFYIDRPGHDIHIRYNFSSRASSHGLQGKAGGHVHNNLFVKNPIAWQMGSGGDGEFADYGLTTGNNYHHNITIDADDISSTQPRGIQGWVTCAVSSICDNNIAIDNTTPTILNEFIRLDHSFEIGLVVSNCISRNWNGVFFFHGSGSAPSSVNDTSPGGNIVNASGLGATAQSLCNTIKSASYIDALVAAQTGVDIYQLKADMNTIRAGIIP